ncbi:MAG: DNA adenine methylase [Chloroflexi bacterium]|nr:DNA adenine methylase [Chloroflexota bacterium]
MGVAANTKSRRSHVVASVVTSLPEPKPVGEGLGLGRITSTATVGANGRSPLRRCDTAINDRRSDGNSASGRSATLETQVPSCLAVPARPFLKWAGGKQRLLGQYEACFPATFDRYVEPFIGGGAVFFHLWNTGRVPAGALLFDNNPELVDTYAAVRDSVDELIERLRLHKERHDRDYYYAVRDADRQDHRPSGVERAARTIYLNKTCYNGLYRVNSEGQFNVPVGSYKNPRILDESHLRTASRALQKANLDVRGFERLLEVGRAGDFIYFDPPYDPVSRTASFTGYTAKRFGDEDQRKLARVFAKLSDRGCWCMLSNSHTPLVLQLYREFRIEVVEANRAINSKANGRGRVNEVVVLNY